MSIHPTAIFDPSARIAESAEIGPYCVIAADVSIGERTRLIAHVYTEGPLAIGDDNVLYPYSSIGAWPQDLKYHGERSTTRIGHRNQIREFVTIQRGTEGGGMITEIGDDNLLMAYVHIAHDVKVGSHIVLANAGDGHFGWSCFGWRLGDHRRIDGRASVLPGGQARHYRRLQRHYSRRAAVFQHRDVARSESVRGEFDRNEAARIFERFRRCGTQDVPIARIAQAQHLTGAGTNRGGGGADRRSEGIDRFHRFQPTAQVR